MLLRYFHLCFRRMKKNRFHTYCIIKLDRLPVLRTLYKSIGSVIIPKTHFSNSRCRRFDVLLFAAFCSICRRYDHCSRGSWRLIDRDLCYAPFRWGASLFIQQTLARDSVFAIVFGCFSRIKKLLGRTETRSHERKCFQ